MQRNLRPRTLPVLPEYPRTVLLVREVHTQGEQRVRYRYSVRLIKIPDGKTHDCTGLIQAVLQAAWNPEQAAWYLTVLVQHEADS